MAKSPQAVAIVEEKKNSLVLSEDLDMSMLEGDAGYGVDDMSAQDVALPFLAILQSGSPQVKEELANAYIEGAKPGMLYNTVSQDIFPAQDAKGFGVDVVACAYERKFVEWNDRDKGGGWISEYAADSDILKHTTKNAAGRIVLKSNMDHFIMETAYHYCLVRNPESGDWEQVVFTMKSSHLKVNKRWNNELVTTRIPGRDMQAPRWLFPYRLSTVPETKGDKSWWSPKLIRADGTVNAAVYKKAKEFAELFKSGMLKRGVEPTSADSSADDEVGTRPGPSGRAQTPQSLDDDIPF